MAQGLRNVQAGPQLDRGFAVSAAVLSFVTNHVHAAQVERQGTRSSSAKEEASIASRKWELMYSDCWLRSVETCYAQSPAPYLISK